MRVEYQLLGSNRHWDSRTTKLNPMSGIGFFSTKTLLICTRSIGGLEYCIDPNNSPFHRPEMLLMSMKEWMRRYLDPGPWSQAQECGNGQVDECGRIERKIREIIIKVGFERDAAKQRYVNRRKEIRHRMTKQVDEAITVIEQKLRLLKATPARARQ